MNVNVMPPPPSTRVPVCVSMDKILEQWGGRRVAPQRKLQLQPQLQPQLQLQPTVYWPHTTPPRHD